MLKAYLWCRMAGGEFKSQVGRRSRTLSNYGAVAIFASIGLLLTLGTGCHDTVYAPGYSEKRFKLIQKGASKRSVFDSLGHPLMVSLDLDRDPMLFIQLPDSKEMPAYQVVATEKETGWRKTRVRLILNEENLGWEVVRDLDKVNLEPAESIVPVKRLSNPFGDAASNSERKPMLSVEAQFEMDALLVEENLERIIRESWRFAISPADTNFYRRDVAFDSAGLAVGKRADFYWD